MSGDHQAVGESGDDPLGDGVQRGRVRGEREVHAHAVDLCKGRDGLELRRCSSGGPQQGREHRNDFVGPAGECRPQCARDLGLMASRVPELPEREVRAYGDSGGANERRELPRLAVP